MGSLLDLAGIVGGGVAGYLGNKSAKKAEKKALKFEKEKYRDAVAERERGRTAAVGLVSPYYDSGAADNAIAGAMTSRPEFLTPSQKIGLEDVTRRTLNNLSVAGMRGAGAGGQAVLADTQRRYLANAFDANQARSDRAADTIASRGERARGTGVNVETGTSGAIANDTLDLGSRGAESIRGQGDANVATANLIGNTVGAIAALANNDRSYDKYGKYGHPLTVI